MFESLYNSRVNINMISTSEIRITVLVPKKNEKDVVEISNEIKAGMEICLVESMDDVIPLAFAREIKVKSIRSKAKTGNSKQEK